MKRLAIFVEGQTEQIFVSKLLIEIAGEKNILIGQEKASKNKKGQRVFTIISASSKISDQKYYVLIRDCGSENNVKSDILDSYKSLTQKNYEKILGLRDVYPSKFKDISKLESGLKYGLPTKPILINILLAIMEVEAWFLAETSHFSRIHPSLTLDRIKKALHFDPTTINVEQRYHPSKDLDDIYRLVGLAYNKKKANVQRTVKKLDYNILYCGLKAKVKNLGMFIGEIDAFLV